MSQRTPEEREAARLERERRRAGREAAPELIELSPPEPEPQPQPESEPAAAPDPEPGEATPEAPAGTRRVNRLQRRPTVPHRPRRPPAAPRSPRARRGSWGPRILALVAIVIVAVALWFLNALFQPFHGSAGAPVRVTIPPHLGSRQIGDLLARDGIVASGFFFELRASLAGERGELRAGTYTLRRNMSYGDALKVLTTPPPPVPTTTLTLVEGETRRQIDALLRREGIRGSYLAATRHSPLLSPSRYGAPRDTPSLEGFLFPSTYQLRKPVRLSALVADQLTTFKRRFAHVDLGYARQAHLSAYDVLIIASIIEKEAGTAHDRPLVASVIYNRLRDHMPLGMDSTTRYQFNDYTQPLTAAQLSSPSPYNTRLHQGLPPTPIGNPGLAAIEAAANPARTNYLYFVVKLCGDGSSVFSSTFAQFQRDAARYQAARYRRGGRAPTHC